MQNDLSRSQLFAKLLTFNERQALVFLQRDNTDKLNVVVQLWSSAHDAQVRALVDVETDDQAQFVFDNLTDETLGEFVEASGLGSI